MGLALAAGPDVAPASPRVPKSAAGGCPIVIDGEVRAGAEFRHALGTELVLLLQPTASGWIVRVLPAHGPRPAEDMAELATPPFRSVNPLLLTTGFGLRAQDVVGWNPRSFRTLRYAREIPAAEHAYAAAVSTNHPSPAAQDAVVRVAASAAEGKLEILDARLAPGTADQTPAAALVATHFLTTAHTIVPPASGGASPLGRLEWLRFRVTVSLPGATGRAACR